MAVKIVSPSGTWVQPPNGQHSEPHNTVKIVTPGGTFVQPPNKPFPPHHPHPTVLKEK